MLKTVPTLKDFDLANDSEAGINIFMIEFKGFIPEDETLKNVSTLRCLQGYFGCCDTFYVKLYLSTSWYG